MPTRSVRGARGRTLIMALAVAAVAAAAPAPAAASGAASSHPPDWRTYVESPSTRDVQPVAVVRAQGQVTHPGALTTAAGDDLTTLTYPPGGTAPVLVLDYGKEVGGVPVFDVAAASGAPLLRAAYSETAAAMSPTGDMTNETNPGAQRFDTVPVAAPGVRSGETIQGGERYELLTLLSPGSVTLRSVGIHFTGVLGTADTLRGHFLSSDDLLNRIWYAGVYTVNLDQVVPGTSPQPYAHDADLRLLVDGAKRDRSVWSADIAMAAGTVYAALDPRYVRDSLQLLGEHPASSDGYLVPAVGARALPGPMPGVCQPYTDTPTCLGYSASYSTVFVSVLADYYRHTGDRAFVDAQWPNVTRVLGYDAEHLDGNGLLPTDGNNGHDWHGGGPALRGEVTWTNLVYFQALVDAAGLADARSDAVAAAGYWRAAAALRDAIDRRLWNPSTGLYDVSDSIRGAVAQDANVFAVLTGVADATRSRAIMATLDDRLATPRGMDAFAPPAPAGLPQVISPYMGGYQAVADFQAGRTQQALDLIRREWAVQIDGDPGGTVWEAVPQTGGLSGAQSAAHAWASGPTAALSAYVLGVRPRTPGFTTFVIAPQPGDLHWAQGAVPTPQGPVDVAWRNDTCTFSMDVTVPAGAVASITVPGTAGARAVTVDGTTRTRDDSAGDATLTNVAAGTHHVRARRSGCS